MQTATPRTAVRQEDLPGKRDPVESSGSGTTGIGAGVVKTSRALQMLEEGISKVSSSDGFRRYLAFTTAFHPYSARNQLLIFLQCPQATMVAGYNRWRKLGRQVRKGEKAIKILAPVTSTVQDKETGQWSQRVSGFRAVNVFALHQTDGAPVPAPPRTGAVEGEEVAARKLYSFLSRICAAEGVGISEKTLGPGHYGYYHRREENIVLADRLSTVEQATTLCHELCHQESDHFCGVGSRRARLALLLALNSFASGRESVHDL